MVDDDVEHDDVPQKELPVQCTHDSEEVNTVDKETDVNGDPSEDSDHTIDAENMTVDEPDRTCRFQYPLLSISILHFVARIFGHK